MPSEPASTTVLRGGRVLDPASDTDAAGDVVISDGRIAEIVAAGAADATGAEVLECDGLWVAPGLIDLHTHLREPGFEEAEDVATASAAAAAGGYTLVCAMPNTDPVCDSPAVAEQVWRRGREVGLVDVLPIGSVTRGQRGTQLSEMGELSACAAGVRMFSDDGHPVADARIMRRALQYATAFDAVVCNHSEEPALTLGAQMHEGPQAAVLGLPGWPREAEEVMIARDLILAAGVGARLHVPHVSTAGSVALIREAKRRGIRVTAEATPHHLSLTDAEVATYDTVFKVNPPLREDHDVTALRAALADGTIDAIATDHAPHPGEDKDQEWEHAPCGMLGLETALAVALGLVADGVLDPLTLVARMTCGPADVLRLDRGRLQQGADADVVVVDPGASWTVTPAQLHSRARNTPWAGRKLEGRAVHTFLRGRATLRDGQVRT